MHARNEIDGRGSHSARIDLPIAESASRKRERETGALRFHDASHAGMGKESSRNVKNVANGI